MAKRGQPPTFKTADELWSKFQEYIESCKPRVETQWRNSKVRVGVGEYEWRPVETKVVLKQKPITKQGFTAWIQSYEDLIWVYGKKPEFSGTVKRIENICEAYAVELLLDPDNRNSTGVIFNLKNNYGEKWVDRTIHDNRNHDLSDWSPEDEKNLNAATQE